MGDTANIGTSQPQFNAMNSSWGASGDYPQQENPMQSMSLQNIRGQQQDSFNPYGGAQEQFSGGQMASQRGLVPPQYAQGSNAGPSQNLPSQQGMMSRSGNQALNQMAPQGQQQMAPQAQQAMGNSHRQNIANQLSSSTARSNVAIPQQNTLNQGMPSQQAMSGQNNPAGSMQAMAAQQQGGSPQQNMNKRQSMIAQQLAGPSRNGTQQGLLNR
jgi:hypothetical protein